MCFFFKRSSSKQILDRTHTTAQGGLRGRNIIKIHIKFEKSTVQIAQKYMGRLRNFILLLSVVTFHFSAKSDAYVVIFLLSMASSFLSSAAVNLCCSSSQKWFLVHAWPTGLLMWGCAAGDTGFSTQPGFSGWKNGVDDHFFFSLQFFWTTCPELVTPAKKRP